MSPYRKKTGLLHAIFSVCELDTLLPGDFMSTGLLDPFPERGSGNKDGNSVTDLMARFATAASIKNVTAQTVADTLLNSYQREWRI
jgi:hypothetical protein